MKDTPARRPRVRVEADLEAPTEGPGLTLRRFLLGLFPAEDGGPPPAVAAARGRLEGLVWGGIGLLVGTSVGFLLVLCVRALPETPALVVGFGAGVLLGGGAAVALASRYPFLRRWGGIAILLSPVLVVLAPFALLGGAVVLLRRLPGRRRRSSAGG